MRVVRLAVSLAMSALMTCTQGDTEVMVRVDSDIATVRDGGPLVRVIIAAGREDDPVTEVGRAEFTSAGVALPGDFLLHVQSADDPRAIEVRVTGEQAHGPPVVRDFMVRPVAGALRLIRVFLAERCRARCDDGLRCEGGVTCPDGATCNRDGTCDDVRVIPNDDFVSIAQDPVASICAPGATRGCYTGPAFTEGVGICAGGAQTCSATGRWGACAGEVLPARGGVTGNGELCNELDDNCDGVVDENCECVPLATLPVTCPPYGGPRGTEGVGVCRGSRSLCTASGRLAPCLGEVTPGDETCNGLDDNCNGTIDENIAEQMCRVGGAVVRFAGCREGVVPPCPLASCAGHTCGRDLLGNGCGTCGVAQICNASSQCVADPCAGRQCGVVQGVVCGHCPGDDECTDDGRCTLRGCPAGSVCLDPMEFCGGGSTTCMEGTCAAHALCVETGTGVPGCNCSGEYVPLSCAGVICNGANCANTHWRCVSRRISTAADLYCGRGPGPACGASYCPPNSTCTSSTRCSCATGYQSVDCSGVPCVGDACPGGNYYCAPRGV